MAQQGGLLLVRLHALLERAVQVPSTAAAGGAFQQEGMWPLLSNVVRADVPLPLAKHVRAATQQPFLKVYFIITGVFMSV